MSGAQFDDLVPSVARRLLDMAAEAPTRKAAIDAGEREGVWKKYAEEKGKMEAVSFVGLYPATLVFVPIDDNKSHLTMLIEGATTVKGEAIPYGTRFNVDAKDIANVAIELAECAVAKWINESPSIPDDAKRLQTAELKERAKLELKRLKKAPTFFC